MDAPTPNVRKKVLTIVVSNLLLELGYDSAEKQALETLAEILQALMIEIGNCSRAYCEVTGRTEPVIGDVIVAIANMGISLQGLELYAMRGNRTVLSPLQQAQQQKEYNNMLKAGTKQKHPSYVPSYLPPFPDPHAYIRTPTHKQPVTEYEAIREKSANQKRDIERALTRFLAKTGQTDNVFRSDDNTFSAIACRPNFPPYLNALLPQDQVFDPEDLEYDVQPDLNEIPRKRIKTERKQSENATQSDGNDDQTNDDSQKNQDESTNNTFDIDNPYLAATKMPNKESDL